MQKLSDRQLQSSRQANGRDWIMIGLFGLGYVLSGVDRQILAFVAVDLKRDLALSNFQIGLVQGLGFTLFYAAAGLPLGWLIDRGPRVRIIAVAMALWSGMTLICGSAQGFAALAAGRVGVGVGEAALTPGVYSIIGDRFAGRQVGLASLLYSLGAPISIAAAASLSAIALGITSADAITFGGVELFGWRLAFFLAGVPGLVLAAALIGFREPARTNGPVNVQPIKGFARYLGQHWRLHGIFITGATAVVMLQYDAAAWAPTVLREVYGWAPGNIASVLGAIGLVGGIAGCLLGGGLASWGLSERRLPKLLTAMALATVGLALTGVLLSTSSNIRAAVAAFILIGSTAPMMLMLIPTVLQSVTPPHFRGRMTAFQLFANVGIGAGLGPTIAGAISTAVGPSHNIQFAVGCVATVSGAIGAVAFYFCIRSFKNHGQ